MRHSALLKILKPLEGRWQNTPTNPPLPPLAGAWVQPIKRRQYFACSPVTSGTTDPDLPVVVIVGINYTQGNQHLPGLGVVDSAMASKAAEKRCIAHCNQNRSAWLSACLCPGGLSNPLLLNASAIPPVQDFHLVATNFSPWITTLPWQALEPAIAADILVNPPHPLGVSGYPFDHLDDLHQELQKQTEPAVWIGHGLKSVAALFRLWTQRMKIQNWMITCNLARPNLVKPRVVPGTPPLIKFR